MKTQEATGPEVRLSDNSRLRLHYNPTACTLSVELWRPGQLPDGHGFLYAVSALLSGEELEKFVRAVGRLEALFQR
jgi:hypothetical protein